MKKAKDIIWAILLLGIATFGIVRFLLMSDILHKNDNATTISESVSESANQQETSNSQDFSSLISQSVSEEPEVSISEEESVSENDTSISEEPEKETVKETKEEKRKRLKQQLPNIMKNITIQDCDIVFIGDSIFFFGDEENDSIPDIMGIDYGLTVYNCSKAGMAAGQYTNDWVSMYDLAKCFAKGKNTKGVDCDIFNYSVNRYVERDHTGRQLVIVLDCCINDYYQHTPMEGSDGSFVTGYENTLYKLKDAFPDAIIICTVPNDVSHEEMGYNFNGSGYTYNMYKDKIYEIAVDFNVFCLRMDNADGICRENLSEYLEDGTHPNAAGRERMVNVYVNYINSILDYVTNLQ